MNTLDNHRRSGLAAATSKALHAGSAVTLTAVGLLAAQVPAVAGSVLSLTVAAPIAHADDPLDPIRSAVNAARSRTPSPAS